MGVPATVTVEAETADDSRTMFRLRINGRVIAEKLTAAQAHLLVGDALERIALPNKGPLALRNTSMSGQNLGTRHTT